MECDSALVTRKAAGNVTKHGVSFEYATGVFEDPEWLDLDTSREADGEARRKAVGVISGRLFAVVYIMRGQVVRIISARPTNRREEKRYGDR